MKSGIYQIINKINNHSYIGSAVSIESRFRTHKSCLKNNKHHSLYLQRAWDKYGEYNFEFLILEYVQDIPLLLKREQYYLDELNPEYNICKIAGSCLGVKGTKESNLKKSLNHAFKGKFGKNNPTSKTIYQYSKEGTFIQEWENAVQIQEVKGFDAGNIRKSVKNRWMFYNNFWSYTYYGEFYKDVPKKNDRTKTKKAIIQYDLQGNLIKEWDSAKEATIFLGTKEGSLNKNLKGIAKTAYGFIWRYKIKEKT